jgi:hypothetical protein
MSWIEYFMVGAIFGLACFCAKCLSDIRKELIEEKIIRRAFWPKEGVRGQ